MVSQICSRETRLFFIWGVFFVAQEGAGTVYHFDRCWLLVGGRGVGVLRRVWWRWGGASCGICGLAGRRGSMVYPSQIYCALGVRNDLQTREGMP
jgi:hypothetical protein